MNKDISLMIELQRFWDNVLRGNNEIEKTEKSILFWKNGIKDKSDNIAALDEEIKQLKISVKQYEIELKEKEDQINKLEKRKDIVKNEKEMTALTHEVEKADSNKDDLENKLIELFDLIKEKESKIMEMKKDLTETEQRSSADIKNLEDRISTFRKSIDENQVKFDGAVDQLSVEVKTKFSKLVKSHNGIAISMIQGENCGACNFQVPFHLIQDILKDNKIVSCTNCGRFLYKI